MDIKCHVIYLSFGMHCRLQGSNIEVFSLHPGIIATGLSRHMGLLKYAIDYGLYFFSKSTEQVRHEGLVDHSMLARHTHTIHTIPLTPSEAIVMHVSMLGLCCSLGCALQA